MEKPRKILDAQLAGDYDALSKMGIKGARQAHLNRINRKKQHAELIEKGVMQNRYEANEHIISPDGEQGEFPDGIIPTRTP